MTACNRPRQTFSATTSPPRLTSFSRTLGPPAVLPADGLILFLLPTWEHLGTKTMSGYVMTTLYLMGPLAGVMGSIALFGRANVALQKIEELGLSLACRSSEVCTVEVQEKSGEWQRLDLVGVTQFLPSRERSQATLSSDPSI